MKRSIEYEGQEYKDIKLRKVMLSLEDSHDDFLRTMANKSGFVRWMLDNYKGYQKYMEEKK